MYFDLAYFEVCTRDRFGSRMPPLPNPSMVASVGSVHEGQVVAEDGAAIGAVVQEGEVQHARRGTQWHRKHLCRMTTATTLQI